MRSRSTLTLVFIAVMLVALAFSGGCKRATERADLGLNGSSATSSTASGSGSASDSANPKAETEIASGEAGADDSSGSSGGSGSTANDSGSGGSSGSDDGDTGSGGSGNGTGGSGSGSGSGGSGGTGNGGTTPAATTMVRIKYWNDVTSGKAASPRIVLGTKTFAPEGSSKPVIGSVGPVVFNKTVKLLVYPDGPSGSVISVPIKVTAGMSPTTDLDAIHVSISNNTVRVLGNPVDNFEHSYDRFAN